jgi:hypothetical protein
MELSRLVVDRQNLPFISIHHQDIDSPWLQNPRGREA